MIALMVGIEGGGKTALITKYTRKHHLLGGEVWAFPGYELMNNRGRVVSKLVYPEEMVGKVRDMEYIVLVIDEIQNFLHHHYWQSPVVDTIANASAQRRKLKFNIFASSPEMDLIPPDMRRMFHVVIPCRDAHWRNKKIIEGTDIRFHVIDNRGRLSGYPGTRTREWSFNPHAYFPFYDTFSLADPKYQHRRYKVEGERVRIDSNGNIIDENNNGVDDSIIIAREISKLKAGKRNSLESWELNQMLGKLGFKMNVGIKALLNSLGVHYNRYQQCYLID